MRGQINVVAETIVQAARDHTPRLRYPSGKAARQAAFARRFAPRSLFDKILRSQFGAGVIAKTWCARREPCHPAPMSLPS
jgi:hypothetical protein